jgi:hypothetical protein
VGEGREPRSLGLPHNLSSLTPTTRLGAGVPVAWPSGKLSLGCPVAETVEIFLQGEETVMVAVQRLE